MPSVRARGMSRTIPLTGLRKRRVVVFVAVVEGRFRVDSVSDNGFGVMSLCARSTAVRSGSEWSLPVVGSRSSCLGDMDLMRLRFCAFDALDIWRASETTSTAARPNEPAVSKEADKIAVMGSHLLGSMWNGLGRKLVLSVSIHASYKSVSHDLTVIARLASRSKLLSK